jgi:hypothetical protein
MGAERRSVPASSTATSSPTEGFHRDRDQVGDLTLEPHVGMDEQ